MQVLSSLKSPQSAERGRALPGSVTARILEPYILLFRMRFGGNASADTRVPYPAQYPLEFL